MFPPRLIYCVCLTGLREGERAIKHSSDVKKKAPLNEVQLLLTNSEEPNLKQTSWSLSLSHKSASIRSPLTGVICCKMGDHSMIAPVVLDLFFQPFSLLLLLLNLSVVEHNCCGDKFFEKK